MDIVSNNIKIKENKGGGSPDAPRFTLFYNQKGSLQEAQQFSYSLLSRLRGDSDVIMELNSDLFVSNGKNKSDIIQSYVEYARKQGLSYRYRKLPSAGGKSFFEKLLSQQKIQEAHELVMHIPSGTWASEGFSSCINTGGARYYFTGTAEIPDDLPDEMSKMTDTDKLDFFKMIVFDLCIMGNMGINTRSMELNDLKNLLDLT